MINWVLRKELKKRQGGISDRTLDRRIKEGRLPPPDYPFGNSKPAWREDVLDAHDLAVAAAAAAAAKSAGPLPVDPVKKASALCATRARAEKARAAREDAARDATPESKRPRGRPRKDREHAQHADQAASEAA
jgi:hypothetical protein